VILPILLGKSQRAPVAMNGEQRAGEKAGLRYRLDWFDIAWETTG
jgi:hypothetical protein